jgi:hypothetical protein
MTRSGHGVERAGAVRVGAARDGAEHGAGRAAAPSEGAA